MEFDLSSVIVGLAGTIATVYGLREARKGSRETAEQQEAAAELAHDQLELEQSRAIRDELRAEADRAWAARDAARREAAEAFLRAQRCEQDRDEDRERAHATARKALEDLELLRLVATRDVQQAAEETERAILDAERRRQQ